MYIITRDYWDAPTKKNIQDALSFIIIPLQNRIVDA